MKNLSECKEYFKDLYTECLENDAFEKNIFECTELARYEMHCETMNFVFGAEFEQVKPYWIKEASEEFYTNQTA